MEPLPHESTGTIGAPEGTTPPGREARAFSRELPLATSDAAFAVIAYAANQAVAGQITFAHLLGQLAHAQARELSTTGAQALPKGALRDALASLARLEASFADSVIDAANRYGRRFAHLAFAFPVPSRGHH